MQVNRRLYRSRHDRLLAGVAGGVAEHFDLDPTLVRILWLVSIFFGGLGLFLYIVMAIIVPLEPEGGPVYAGGTPPVDAAGRPIDGPAADGQPATVPAGWGAGATVHHPVTRDNGRLATFFGVAMILLGGLALVHTLLPGWLDSGRILWPLFFVGIGVFLVVGAIRREPTRS
jgi:phage shock protein C